MRYNFVNVTAEAGLHHSPSRAWGAAWGDVTGTGRPDLFVGRHWAAPRLFLNREGRYERLGNEKAIFSPRKIDRHACAWGEANGDGRPDIYCVQGAKAGRGEAPNQLLVQDDNGFVDRARAFGVRNRFGRGRTVQWLDYDKDGRLDLFVGNRGPRSGANILFRNTGHGFEKVEDSFREKLRTIGSSWADWTGNGYPDMLILQDENGPDGAIAYENQGGRWKRVTVPPIARQHWLSAAWGDLEGDGKPDVHLVGKESALLLHNAGSSFKEVHRMSLDEGRMSAWLDVDNDGDLDLFVAQGAPGKEREDPDPDAVNAPNFMLVQTEGGFKKVGNRAIRGPQKGNTDSVTTADYNRDGKMDVLVTNGYLRFRGHVALLENRSETGDWVGVNLKGDNWNPWGVGTKVRVDAPHVNYWRHVLDGFNSRAQSEVGYLHLGIAESTWARIRIQWPDGTQDCTATVKNRIIEVRKGTQPC